MAKQTADQWETPAWSLDATQWDAILRRASAHPNVLEDGAFVEADSDTSLRGLVFFATARNKPSGWAYPFLEAVPHGKAFGASVGRVWHEPDTGLVQFEVSLLAAAQTLAADYESGASDLDFVTYEQAVEQAVRGTPDDLAWLHQEFGRLALLTVS